MGGGAVWEGRVGMRAASCKFGTRRERVPTEVAVIRVERVPTGVAVWVVWVWDLTNGEC